MQIERNFHCEESKKETILVRVPDVDMFPAQKTLSWQISEPTESIVKELFNARFDLMGGADKNFLKLHAFRVLSKTKIQGGKFCAFWWAKVQYSQKFFLSELNLQVKENQFLFLHGRFTFWLIGNEWKAKIC